MRLMESTCSSDVKIYPNPSSGTIHLRYSLLAPRTSLLEVYSIQGIKLRTLLSEVQQPGEYELTFDISSLPAGIYFVNIQIGRQVEAIKIAKVDSIQ